MNRSDEIAYTVVKTIIDYFLAVTLLILLLPVILILSLLIMTTGKGPVFYTQNRVGKNGRIFKLYKFRSMDNCMENGTHLLSGRNDNRITEIGRFMRKHKLDEIPNFYNILKGEMSLVGPRPEQKFFTEQLIAQKPEYSQIHSIKPGITSWGQVKYGYASNIGEMHERLEYDLYYHKNRSLLFDLRIAVMTLGVIVKGQGI